MLQVHAKLSSDERYGLTSQLRRAAVSIRSNVAEGYGRRTTKSYAHHVSIALGSHAEIETCLEIATRLGYLDAAAHDALASKLQTLGRLLYALHRSLRLKLQ
jgi:four helix bundle protein